MRSTTPDRSPKIMAALVVIALVVVGLFFAMYAEQQNRWQAQAQTEKSSVTTLSEPQKLDTPYQRTISRIALEDGTPCVVINGHQVAGIDCNWQASEPNHATITNPSR